jgi:hypothetical protein
VSGPFGADIDPRPPRCGRCGHGGQVHRYVAGQGSVICHDCPDQLCQPATPGTVLAGWGRRQDDEDEIDRAQRPGNDYSPRG